MITVMKTMLITAHGNNVKELGWLGYYLGRNTSLEEAPLYNIYS